MKQAIHPDYTETTITCSGCKTVYKTRATAQNIEVEICANCHPFYTGKQKLVDVAGRVDRFKAQQAAAKDRSPKSKSPTAPKKGAGQAKVKNAESKESKKDLASLKELKDS